MRCKIKVKIPVPFFKRTGIVFRSITPLICVLKNLFPAPFLQREASKTRKIKVGIPKAYLRTSRLPHLLIFRSITPLICSKN